MNVLFCVGMWCIDIWLERYWMVGKVTYDNIFVENVKVKEMNPVSIVVMDLIWCEMFGERTFNSYLQR